MLPNTSPPNKRLKPNSTDSQILEEIKDDVHQALQFLCAIKLHNLQETQRLETIALTARKLRNELQTLVPNFGMHQSETVFNTVKSQMLELLPTVSFSALINTSSTMHKALSPLISEVFLPHKGKIQFKFLKPTTLYLVDSGLPDIIPPTITAMNFDYDFDKPIRRLPDTITHIKFGALFNQKIDHALPPSLIHLSFGNAFNLPVDCLPPKITHLTFGELFNQPVNSLPQTITHLAFGYAFNHPLTNIPPGLLSLVAGGAFEGSINELPDTVRTLKTSTTALTHKLPSSLTHFKIHTRATDNLNACTLPPSLTNLSLHGASETADFSKLPALTRLDIAHPTVSHSLENLSPTLKKLVIKGSWKGSLDHLPHSLTHLTLDSLEFNSPLKSLPPSLTLLTLGLNLRRFSHPLDGLPQSLRHFTSGIGALTSEISDTPITHLELPFVLDKNSISLPQTLSHLILSFEFNLPLPKNAMPQNLTHLKFGDIFNQNVDHLPPALTYLEFGNEFNQNVDKLPQNLTHLRFGFDFNQPVAHLPPKITHLFFGHAFNQRVKNLPSSVTHLSFGYSFNQRIHRLPRSLTHLRLGVLFSKPIYNLPDSLYSLDVVFFFNVLKEINVIMLPRNLKVLSSAYVFDYGKQNGINTNHDEFTRENFRTGFNRDDLYAYRVRFTFFCQYFFSVPMSTQRFVQEFIDVCPPSENL